MREIKSKYPMPSLADAVKELRHVQMAWNNTHSRRQSNAWECFEVVLSHLEGRPEGGAPTRLNEWIREQRDDARTQLGTWQHNPPEQGDPVEQVGYWLGYDDALGLTLAHLVNARAAVPADGGEPK